MWLVFVPLWPKMWLKIAKNPKISLKKISHSPRSKKKKQEKYRRVTRSRVYCSARHLACLRLVTVAPTSILHSFPRFHDCPSLPETHYCLHVTLLFAGALSANTKIFLLQRAFALRSAT